MKLNFYPFVNKIRINELTEKLGGNLHLKFDSFGNVTTLEVDDKFDDVVIVWFGDLNLERN